MSAALQLVREIVGSDADDPYSPTGGTIPLNDLPLPTAGYLVGGATQELTFDRVGVIDVNEIFDYVNGLSDVRYVGWWIDDETGKVHIDGVSWFQEHDAAARVARERREIAFYDVARSRDLRLTYVDGE